MQRPKNVTWCEENNGKESQRGHDNEELQKRELEERLSAGDYSKLAVKEKK